MAGAEGDEMERNEEGFHNDRLGTFPSYNERAK